MSSPLVVVGDSLLDIDLDGSAGRLAPDAPVPVLDELVETARPGGAALAASMAAEHGRDVVLLTAIADDPEGERILELLDGRVEVVALTMAGATPVKKRVRAEGRPVVRLDSGGSTARVVDDAGMTRRVLAGAGAVLVSDYGRGMTRAGSLGPALATASGRVPVVWDPHPRGTAPVPGVRLATPNAGEAATFSGPASPSSAPGLASHAAHAEAALNAELGLYRQFAAP